MRIVVLALLLLSWPAWVAAQGRTVSDPPPSIGLPLPPIGLPLPPIGLDPPVDPPGSIGRPPRPGGGGRRPVFPRQPIVFFGAPYAFGFDVTDQAPTPGMVIEKPAPAAPEPQTGWLRLEVEPSALVQVYLDGEFVGALSDFNGELGMGPGSWRVELRAPGYEPLSFDARITANRTLTYRGALTPTATSPGATAPPPPPSDTTFYLIPGCYMGNVPPEQVKLPEGCDLTRVMTYKPGR